MRVVVVARHDEPIEWLAGAPDGWERMVVQKGIHMENAGREAASFFWAFDRLYDRLADDDTVMCLQGWPFDHAEEIPWDTDDPGFLPVGGQRHSSDKLGYPTHGKLRVGERLAEWFGIEFPQGGVMFSAGGQFAVSGSRIRRYPRDLYRRLIPEMDERNHMEGPWVMERLWETIYA